MFTSKPVLVMILSFTFFIAQVSLTFAQEDRIALVIGNSDYVNLPRLKNPENDADALSTALSNLGFTVYLARNLKHAELLHALSIYSNKSKHADVSLIYYAGHSAAIGQQNLIFPVDFDPQDSQQLTALVKLSDITKLLQNGSQTNIILFDACLEPITFKTQNGEVALKALSPPVPPVGTLISYASALGYAAHDGSGQHSLFTGALLDNLAQPDIDIEQTLRRVRRDVTRNSQGVQVPQTSSSLVTDFFFYPTRPQYSVQSLQNALLHNGFGGKPILDSIASGVKTPSKEQNNFGLIAEKAILRDVLCANLTPPRPAICKN
jgi:uncharacterized caspase-like protein